MATAVANSKHNTDTAPQNVWVPSLIGAALVLGGLALVLQGIPYLWSTSVTPSLRPMVGKFADFGLQSIAYLAGTVAIVLALRTLGGAFPVRGLRGGITLAVSLVIGAFFLIRAAIMIVLRMAGPADGVTGGSVFSLLMVSLGLYLIFAFVTSRRMKNWSSGLENAGWFSIAPFKRTQGQIVRRFTLLGLLVIVAYGVMTLSGNNLLASMANENGDWVLDIPFLGPIVVLPTLAYTMPFLLIVAGLWFAWRVVNYPTFADFLIATEAEMNKVSWTSRKNLIKDTIVVMITLFVITSFLFVVDVFWGTILSREVVGILPSAADKQQFISSKPASKEIPW